MSDDGQNTNLNDPAFRFFGETFLELCLLPDPQYIDNVLILISLRRPLERRPLRQAEGMDLQEAQERHAGPADDAHAHQELPGRWGPLSRNLS